ncbi:hypothetical protein P5W92_27375 [Streptomyces sp. J15]|uniref:Uncharacterized protein n=1 Tax=Streptomyces pakalii TaxID=3036494 RepID=A0ABT7DE47_9ACTN|nr:hypothetical protein [Streptomyces pakalii]
MANLNYKDESRINTQSRLTLLKLMEDEVDISMEFIAMLFSIGVSTSGPPPRSFASSSFNCGSIDLQVRKRSRLKDRKRNQP